MSNTNTSLVEINIDIIEKTLSNFLDINNFSSMESFFSYQVVVDSVVRDIKTGALILNNGSKESRKSMESTRSIISKHLNLSDIDKKNKERDLFLRSVSSNVTRKFSKLKKAYLDIVLEFKDRNAMDYLDFNHPSSFSINHAKLVEDNYDLNKVDNSLNSLALALDVYNNNNLFSIQDFYLSDIAMYDVFFSSEAWSISVASFVAMKDLYNKLKSKQTSNQNNEQQQLDLDVQQQKINNNIVDDSIEEEIVEEEISSQTNKEEISDQSSLTHLDEQLDSRSIDSMDIEDNDSELSCLFDTDGDMLCGVTNKYHEGQNFSRTDKSNQRLQTRFNKYKSKGNLKIYFSKSFQPQKDNIFNNDDFYKYIGYRDSFFKYIENGSFNEDIFFKNLITDFQTNTIQFKYCIFLKKDLSFDQFRKFRNVMINFNKSISF